MSYKTEIKVCGDPAFYPNGVTFATDREAHDYGLDKVCAWTLAETYRVIASDQTPNYRYDGGLVPLKVAQ